MAFLCERGAPDCGTTVVLAPAACDARSAAGAVVAADWPDALAS
jgi:hypothetical protein